MRQHCCRPCTIGRMSGTFMVDYSAGMQLTIGVPAAYAERWTSRLPGNKLLAVLEAAGVPCGRVNGVAQAVHLPPPRLGEHTAEILADWLPG